MAKDHGPQIKDDARYEALRRQGEQGKAGRIANTSRSKAARHGGKSPHEEVTRSDLYWRAREIGIEAIRDAQR